MKFIARMLVLFLAASHSEQSVAAGDSSAEADAERSALDRHQRWVKDVWLQGLGLLLIVVILIVIPNLVRWSRTLSSGNVLSSDLVQTYSSLFQAPPLGTDAGKREQLVATIEVLWQVVATLTIALIAAPLIGRKGTESDDSTYSLARWCLTVGNANLAISALQLYLAAVLCVRDATYWYVVVPSAVLSAISLVTRYRSATEAERLFDESTLAATRESLRVLLAAGFKPRHPLTQSWSYLAVCFAPAPVVALTFFEWQNWRAWTFGSVVWGIVYVVISLGTATAIQCVILNVGDVAYWGARASSTHFLAPLVVVAVLALEGNFTYIVLGGLGQAPAVFWVGLLTLMYWPWVFYLGLQVAARARRRRRESGRSSASAYEDRRMWARVNGDWLALRHVRTLKNHRSKS